MMPKIETSGAYAVEEWSTPVNLEENLAIKAEREEKKKGSNVRGTNQP